MTAPLQPLLFPVEAATGDVELFPAVWQAAEGLTAADVAQRTASLEELDELGAARLSPLVAYLLATRLVEPDLPIRARVVEVLADVLAPDSQGRPAPDAVRSRLIDRLSQMRTRSVFAILQVSVAHPHLWGHVSRLLNACPYAGVQLGDILANRRLDIAVRQQAAHHIGQVGFLDALPTLKRLEARLEARSAGQRKMPFAPPATINESALLPSVKSALKLLQSP